MSQRRTCTDQWYTIYPRLCIQGKSYLEIAKSGGGIWDSVTQTRKAGKEQLINLVREKIQRYLSDGLTTVEIKSGYGLDLTNELKQLRAILKDG